ncbi:uncharacterized protein LOC62_02G002990 [Vanrija pseudolonga]|uniref:Uncharacterized protein n=1 Tax=Vanrija pseudolonga TaxID=143232 RepID=A0AAF1BPI8_9TREE|nr:hypothetical protein LOC62_02G002990 [Vanrija pseudolonga]
MSLPQPPLSTPNIAVSSAPRLQPRASGSLRSRSSTISRNSTAGDTLALGDLFGTRSELADLREVLAAGPPTRSPSRNSNSNSRRSSLNSPAETANVNRTVSPRLSRSGIVEVDSRPLLSPRSRDSLLPPSPLEPQRLTPSGRPKPAPRPANIVDPPRNRRPTHTGLHPRDSRVGPPERPPVSYRKSSTPSHRRRLSLIEVLADKDFAANPANVIVRDFAQAHDEEEELDYDHLDDDDDAVSVAQRRDFEFWHEVLRYSGPEDKVHPSGIATSTVDVGKYQTPPPTPTLAKGQPKLRKSPSLAQSVLKLLTRSKPAHDAPPSPQLPEGYKSNPTASAPSSVSKASTRSSVGSSAPLLGRGFASFRKDKGEMTGSVQSSKSRKSRAEEPGERAYTPSVHSYAPSHSSRHEQPVINVNVNIAPAVLAATPTLAPAPTSRPPSTRSRPSSLRSVVAPVVIPAPVRTPAPAPTPAPVSAPAGPRRLPSVPPAPAAPTPVAPSPLSAPRKGPPPPLVPPVREAPTVIATTSSTPTSSVLLANAKPQVAKVATRAPAQVVIVKPTPSPVPQIVVLPAAAAATPVVTPVPPPAPAQIIVVPAATPTPAPPTPLVKEVPIVMPTARPPQVVVVPASSRSGSRIAVPTAPAPVPVASPVVVVPAAVVSATAPPPIGVAPAPPPMPVVSAPVTILPAAVPAPTPVAAPVVAAPAAVPPPVPAPAPAPSPAPTPAPRVEVVEKHIDVITPEGDIIEKITRTTTTTEAKPKAASVAATPVPPPAPQLVVNKPIQHVVNTPPAPVTPPTPEPMPEVDRVKVVEKIIVPAGTAPEAVEKALDTLARVEAAETRSSAPAKPGSDFGVRNLRPVPPAPGTKAGIEPIKMVDYKSLIKRKPVKQWPPPKPGSDTTPAPQPKKLSSVSVLAKAASTPLPPSPVKDAASVPLPPSPVKNPASVPLPPSPTKNPASILLPASPAKNPASVPLPPSPTKATSKTPVASKHEKVPSVSVKEKEKAPSTKSTPGEVIVSIGKQGDEASVETKETSRQKATPKDWEPKSRPGEITISIGGKKDEQTEKAETAENPKDTPSKTKTDAVKAAIAKIELKGAGTTIDLATAAAIPMPASRPASIRSVHSTKSHHRADSIKSVRSVRSVRSAMSAAEAPNVIITAGGTKIEVVVPEPQKAGSVPVAVPAALAKIAAASKHKHSASTPSLPSLKKAADDVECVDVSVHKTAKGEEVTAKIHSHARRGSAPASVVGEGKKKSHGEDESKNDKDGKRHSNGHKHDKDDTKSKADKKEPEAKHKDDAHKHSRKDSQKLAPKEVVHEADSDLEIEFIEKDLPDGKQTTVGIRRRLSRENVSSSREASPSKAHHDRHRHERQHSFGHHHSHERPNLGHHHSHERHHSHSGGHERHHPLGQHHDHRRHHRTRSSMDSKRRHHHHRPSSGEDSDSDGSFYSTRSRSSRQSRGGSFDIPRPPLVQQRPPYLTAPVLQPGAGPLPVPAAVYGAPFPGVPGMPGMMNLHGMAAGVGVPGIGYASGHPIVVPMGAPVATAPVPPVAFSAVPGVARVPMGWTGAHGAPQYPMGSRPPPHM